MSQVLRQHLIDPEVCIRCNTCEEACPRKAITHDKKNYVVDFEKCDSSGNCLPGCPTGAIDSWRRVFRPLTVAEQLKLESLPDDVSPPTEPSTLPPEVEAITKVVHTMDGNCPPPWSAAHPYIGLYSPERPATATVTGNLRLTLEGAENDIHHLVLDFGAQAFPVLEGQSIGIIPPGVDADGQPHALRLYSVASPRDGERPKHNNLALTVKRVTVDRDGQATRGVASNYLCDLKRGETVRVTGPYGSRFLMPNHPGAKLLMICTGTGAAPMRAMTERRRRRMALAERGELLLFFGARTPDELPYFGPLMKLPERLIQVELAFSRLKNEPKEYVQDRMRRRKADVLRYLRDENCFIFICGHKRMEEGVKAALSDIAQSGGLDWPAELEKMRSAGRFHVETY